jgi:hypothetical protein
VVQITWQPRHPQSSTSAISFQATSIYIVRLRKPLLGLSTWPFLMTIQYIARKCPRGCARRQASPYYYQDAKLSPLLRFRAPMRLSTPVPIALQNNFWRLFNCAAECKNAALSFRQEMSSVAAPACCTSCGFVFVAGQGPAPSSLQPKSTTQDMMQTLTVADHYTYHRLQSGTS